MRKALSRIAAIMGLAAVAGAQAPNPQPAERNPVIMATPRGFKRTRTPYAENGMSRHKQKMKCRIYCAPKKRKK